MIPERAYNIAATYGPNNETRIIACQEPGTAYFYAIYIDKCPKDETRKGASKKAIWANAYARDVDKGFHQETWDAVKGTKYEEEYKNFFKQAEKDKII
jgi:hypothetical protein